MAKHHVMVTFRRGILSSSSASRSLPIGQAALPRLTEIVRQAVSNPSIRMDRDHVSYSGVSSASLAEITAAISDRFCVEFIDNISIIPEVGDADAE